MIESIWHNFHQQLFNFIQSKANDHALAEDILQNVFIKVHTNIDNLTSEDKLQSWLYQICRNAIIDYYRQKRLEISEDDPDIFIAENQNAFDQQQLNCCLRILIADLPENIRDILIDSELEQVKQKTFTENNALSLASVKSRIKRGRVQLKNKLQASCDFEFKEAGPEANCKNKCGCER